MSKAGGAPTRSVTLAARASASQARLKLLTYRMALAQPGASVPLIRTPEAPAPSAASAASAPPPATVAGGDSGAETVGGAALLSSTAGELARGRRWVREADELCVASVRRSNSVNHINSYVATYKFDDPQWRPLLLPQVQVFGSHAPSPAGDGAAPPSTPAGEAATRARGGGGAEVYVDYNKLVTLELISRHANFSLRHLVQKGHAMYLVNFAQHSLLHTRGLVETSYITCAYGVRGERLRTYLTHVGPLDVRDVIEVDPRTARVSFNLRRRHVRRGVVALSLVEGYGTWFQRKPMLWQRTRRVGALQSTLGAYDYQLCAPAAVGRQRDYEVSLLQPHLRFFGAGGGAEAVGLVADSQVAQNDRLYVGQFEAPAMAAVDAVQQLAHAAALRARLVRPAAGDTPEALAAAEQLLPVSWVTRTPPPYVPLESDLPFRVQLSRPAVFAACEDAAALPGGGTVGSPMVCGAPLSMVEYNIHQGVDHYVFDDAPSARPLKWWNQKSNIPYNGHMYFARSGVLDRLRPSESVPNPLAAPVAARRKRQTRRRPAAARRTAESAAAEGAADDVPEPPRQRWDGGSDSLVGHDDDTLRRAAAEREDSGEDEGRVRADQLVPPPPAARRRAARYWAAAEEAAKDDAPTAGGEAGSSKAAAASAAAAPPRTPMSASERAMRRQMRLRRSRQEKGGKTPANSAAAAANTPPPTES